MRAFCRILLTGVVLAATAVAAHGATIPVTTTIDGPITGAGSDGLCSLREAVVAAVNDSAVQGCPAGSGADVVVLPAGTFTLTTIGFNEDQGFAGDLDVTGPALRVVGAGAGATVIQVGSEDRAFDVLPSGDLTLEGLTVRGARFPDFTGASGAGVRNQGSLTVIRVAFDDNAAARGEAGSNEGGHGGAIWSGNRAAAAVTVIESTFTNNRAGDGSFPGGDGGDGGAIRIASGTLSVARSTFAGNAGGAGREAVAVDRPGGIGGDGGAIAVGPGTATITGSTFASNRGGPGGLGTSSGAPNPTGGNGGAVFVSGGQALVDWSTFLGNVRGGGSAGPNGISGAIVGSSILADPEPRCGGVVASVPNLLSGPDGACLPGSPVGDPRLGLLADNGGPTSTLLPGAGSAAINAAGVGCPAIDQRGLARPALGACDFGAVEIQPGAASAGGVPGTGGGPAALGTRTIGALTLGPATFRAAGRKPLGTNVRFRLGTAGTVVLTVRRPAAGKRSKGRCVAPTRKLRAARSCTRQVTLPGKLTRQGVAGENLIRFSGKLNGRALPASRYTLVVTLPRTGSSPALTAVRAFRIAS